MTMMQWAVCAAILGLIAANRFPARAAEGVPAPSQKVHREEVKDEFKKLSPEERQAKIKELREKNGGPNRVEIEKRREEFQKLSPAEKEARLKERKERAEKLGLTPEERQARRKAMQDRMQHQLTELRKKKTDGTISTAETQRLERLEQVSKRFAEGPPAAAPAQPVPPASVPAPPK